VDAAKTTGAQRQAITARCQDRNDSGSFIPMSRIVQIAGALFAIVAVTAAIVLFLAYGVRTGPPGRDRVPGLEERVTAYWSSHGTVHIEARSTADFLVALGYAHGMNRTWLTMLARQIALGRASEWFGHESLSMDRLARRLGFGEAAKSAYDSLPPTVRSRYDLLAQGINAALATEQVRRQPPFVLLGIEPEPWEPWQSLAVESLWAWLASPVQRLSASSAGLEELLEADRALRSRVHIFGMADDLALVAGGGAKLRHLFRYVMGDSGQPAFQEFEFVRNGDASMDGLSIPGTLAIPAGRSGELSWTYLLSSAVNVVPATQAELAAAVTSYSRIRDDRGGESVVRTDRAEGALLVGNVETDSLLFALHWAGLDGGNDAAAWNSLLDGREPSFSLLTGDGIVVSGPEAARIVGRPSTRFSHESGLRFASNSDAANALVSRLERIIAGETDVQSDWDILHDTYSETSESWETAIVSAVDSMKNRSPSETEALEYLRNWDLSYRGSSIAASILEQTRATLGDVPRDSLRPEVASRALATAVAYLVDRFGPDMREWRWEAVQQLTVYFPGWSETTSSDSHRLVQFKEEFLPVRVVGQGHPTTMAWGPAIGRAWRRAPSAYEGLFGHAPGSDFEFERPAVAYSSFLGRFLAEYRATVSVHMNADESENRRTILDPKR